MLEQIAFAATACLLGLNYCASAAELGEIMSMGDSITFGDTWTWTGGHWGQGTATYTPLPGGYRDELYRDLTNAGCAFQFVGSKTDNSTPLLTAAGQSAHEAHPGYGIGNMDQNLEASYAGDPGHYLTGLDSRPPIYPDSILLMIGTVDVIGGANPAYVATGQMDILLDHLFSLRPTTHIYLSTMLPGPDFTQLVAGTPVFNNYIPGEVAKYQNQGRAITLVDNHAQFINADGSDNPGLFFDGVHPTQFGYNVLGDSWATALLAGKSLNVTGSVTLRPDSAGWSLGSVQMSAGGVLVIAGPNASAGMVRTGIIDQTITTMILGDVVGYDVGADGSIVVLATLPGDTNLDGRVDVTDLGNLATEFGIPSGEDWQQGDFDYNGAVDVADLGDLATDYNGESASASVATPVITAMPEPMSGLVVASAVLFAFRRTNRRPYSSGW